MSKRLRLVLASFLMLFVELALIRWTGSNVLYLSYISNFVLLKSADRTYHPARVR